MALRTIFIFPSADVGRRSLVHDIAAHPVRLVENLDVALSADVAADHNAIGAAVG